jgi:hypothetical protein
MLESQRKQVADFLSEGESSLPQPERAGLAVSPVPGGNQTKTKKKTKTKTKTRSVIPSSSLTHINVHSVRLCPSPCHLLSSSQWNPFPRYISLQQRCHFTFRVRGLRGV